MRKATRIVAAALGLLAGFGGPEHGYFEIQQGHIKPDSLIISSMGPPCIPEEIWNACEPAMTIIPSYLITGILATLVGIITMVWSAAFINRKRGGMILILLSVLLLLVGGGLFPPLIGIIGGLTAHSIHRPFRSVSQNAGKTVVNILAALWPWSLVAFFIWIFGQFIVGYYYNDFLINSGFLIPGLILGLIALSLLSASAYDKSIHHKNLNNKTTGDSRAH
jgi:hypothetical protein